MFYDVAGFEFETNEAFGEVWKRVKQLAQEYHTVIYRNVYRETYKGVTEEREVYLTCGMFLSTEYANAENIKVF